MLGIASREVPVSEREVNCQRWRVRAAEGATLEKLCG